MQEDKAKNKGPVFSDVPFASSRPGFGKADIHGNANRTPRLAVFSRETNCIAHKDRAADDVRHFYVRCAVSRNIAVIADEAKR